MATTQEQTSILADEQTQQALVPNPIELNTRRHVSLVVTAVDDRAATIEALAKKAEAEGYHRISRELRGDVHMLREEVLPAIREQQELPLAGPDEARAAIANYLRPTIRAALAAKERDEYMLDRLAGRLMPLLERVYEIGFSVGVTRRTDDPEYAIIRAAFRAANEEADSMGADRPSRRRGAAEIERVSTEMLDQAIAGAMDMAKEQGWDVEKTSTGWKMSKGEHDSVNADA